MTRKNARFIWGPEQDRAFRLLKEKLTAAPILGMPPDEGTYYSDVGLGAVLSKYQEGQERLCRDLKAPIGDIQDLAKKWQRDTEQFACCSKTYLR